MGIRIFLETRKPKDYILGPSNSKVLTYTHIPGVGTAPFMTLPENRAASLRRGFRGGNPPLYCGPSAI